MRQDAAVAARAWVTGATIAVSMWVVAARWTTPLAFGQQGAEPSSAAGDSAAQATVPAAGAVAPDSAAVDAAPAAAPELVDRIVAMVDEEPILLSDLEREVETFKFEAQAANQPLPQDESTLRADMLERLVQVKLLVAQAKLDGITIGDDELDAAVARAMEDMIERFGTRRDLERELQQAGMTYGDLEARNRELIRNRLYTTRIVATHVRPQVEVREDEVRRYYEEHKDQVPQAPAQVTLANILVVPQPSEEAQRAIRQKLDAIQRELDLGVAFEEVARKHSQDNTAASGGKLGTFAKGDLFNGVLEDAAWAQPVGVVGPPITTEIGVHLLRVDARTDTEVTLSQIMLRLTMTDAEWTRAHERAVEVSRLAREGRDFAELAKNYSDDPTSRDKGGELGVFPEPELSPVFRQALEGLAQGGVAEPVRGAAGWFVLKLVARTAPQAPGYDAVAERLRQVVEEEKIQAELEKFLTGLRTRFYIDLKT